MLWSLSYQENLFVMWNTSANAICLPRVLYNSADTQHYDQICQCDAYEIAMKNAIKIWKHILEKVPSENVQVLK